jgi:hypothetical protein
VTTFEKGRRMVRTGGMPPGLFKGERSFDLAPKNDSSVDFTFREGFSGPLLGMFARSLPDMIEPFRDFVAGLKARVEQA